MENLKTENQFIRGFHDVMQQVFEIIENKEYEDLKEPFSTAEEFLQFVGEFAKNELELLKEISKD